MKPGLWAILMLLWGGTAFAYQGDQVAGKRQSVVCAACHGVDGNSMIPENPTLAGQNYTYLVQVLKDYRSGQRNNPIMNGQAAGLSDEDIANLAKYFSTQNGRLADMPASGGISQR